MTMAGTLYVTLVSWAELSRSAAARKGWLRSVLVSPPPLPPFLLLLLLIAVTNLLVQQDSRTYLSSACVR